MEIQDIKDYIINNDKTEYVLEELNCHHIKLHSNKYYSCGFPDGDNIAGMAVYINTLNVDAYTRDIKDKFGNSDIISLVCFLKNIYFTQAIKWLCEILDLDYYGDAQEDLPPSLKLTRMLLDMCNDGSDKEDYEVLKPTPESVLASYIALPNRLFLDDGISCSTQVLFELGVDLCTNRITIPVRDELGTLVGVKGRSLDKECHHSERYIYLEPCSKTKVLYGLHLTMEYIKVLDCCIVVESEKSVMKLWDYGVQNAVSIGGHSLSATQVEKITRLGISKVILCYDEEVNRDESGKINKKEYKKEADKFIEQINVTAMVDLKGTILDKKESPADNYEKFLELYNTRKELR